MKTTQTRSQAVARPFSDLIRQNPSQRRVAIIGSGPGGLVAAKFLKQHGWEPVLFEQNDSLGGQWNVRSPHSGVWPSMVTNTSRWLTCFSDLAPEPKGAIFPSNGEILAYLGRYAQRFDLLLHIRYATRVESIERDVRSVEEFDAIILGTGFELSPPFLSAAICRTPQLDARDAELYHFTFHPDLAGLAFLGLWEQTGPYFPPLELQARWITYA